MGLTSTLSSAMLRSKKTRQKIITVSSVQIVDGREYSPSVNQDQLIIRKLNKRMQNNGLKNTSNLSISTQKLAASVLQIAGISLTTHTNRNKIDFSLIATQLDTETLDNPNILNPAQYTNIQKRKIAIGPMFPNLNDPIYVLDDAPPIGKQTQMEAIKDAETVPDLVSLAYDMNKITENPNQPTLRNFTRYGGV